jgi:hypothetical protein
MDGTFSRYILANSSVLEIQIGSVDLNRTKSGLKIGGIRKSYQQAISSLVKSLFNSLFIEEGVLDQRCAF